MGSGRKNHDREKARQRLKPCQSVAHERSELVQRRLTGIIGHHTMAPSVRIAQAQHNEREQQLIVEQIFLQQSSRRQLVVEYKAPPIPIAKHADPEIPPVRILSIDGGGLRGCLSCQILKVLEQSSRTGRIADMFDLVVGTSTGGLLAAAIANGMTMDEIDQLYNRVAHDIFYSHADWLASLCTWWVWQWICGVVSLLGDMIGRATWWAEPEGFSSTALETIYQESMGPFSMMRDHDSTDLPDIALVSTRIDLSDAQPFIFRTYPMIGSEDTYHDPDRVLARPFPGTHNASWWEACRATSAAPTYFKSITLDIEGSQCKFVDGGIVANDPSIIAYIEAKNKFPNRKYFLVSVGTGQEPVHRGASSKNVVSMALEVAGGQFSAKEALHRMVVRNLLKEGDSYFRFNCLIENAEMSMEQYMPEWRQIGRDYAMKPPVRKSLADIATILNAGARVKTNFTSMFQSHSGSSWVTPNLSADDFLSSDATVRAELKEKVDLNAQVKQNTLKNSGRRDRPAFVHSHTRNKPMIQQHLTRSRSECLPPPELSESSGIVTDGILVKKDHHGMSASPRSYTTSPARKLTFDFQAALHTYGKSEISTEKNVTKEQLSDGSVLFDKDGNMVDDSEELR